MLDYIELGHGKFRVIEPNITATRAKELQDEMKQFNFNSTNGIYRMVRSDFSGKQNESNNKKVNQTSIG
jgi:hypothetical protein